MKITLANIQTFFKAIFTAIFTAIQNFFNKYIKPYVPLNVLYGIGIIILIIAAAFFANITSKLFTNNKTDFSSNSYYAKHYYVLNNKDLSKKVSLPINKLYIKTIFLTNDISSSKYNLIKMNNKDFIYINNNTLYVKLDNTIILSKQITFKNDLKYIFEVKVSNNNVGIQLKSTNLSDEEDNILFLNTITSQIDLSKLKISNYTIVFSNNITKEVDIDEVTVDINKYNTADL